MMRKTLAALAALLVPLMVPTVDVGAAAAEDPAPVNLGGFVLRGDGNNFRQPVNAPQVSQVSCDPDGGSRFTFRQSTYPGFFTAEPFVGRGEVSVTVELGPLTLDSQGRWRGPVTAVTGSYQVETLRGQDDPGYRLLTGALSLAGVADPSDSGLGDVTVSGSCAQDPTQPWVVNQKVHLVDVRAVVAYTATFRDSQGIRHEAPGGQADLSLDASSTVTRYNQYTLLTLDDGRFGLTFGSTGDFVAAPPDPARTLTLSPRSTAQRLDWPRSVQATVTTDGGGPADGARLVLVEDGAVIDSCGTLLGRCAFDVQPPAGPGVQTVTVCADADLDDTCDPGELAEDDVITWFAPGDPAPVETPTGSDVPVTVADQDGAAAVELVFDSVTSPGTTTVSTSTEPPPAGAPSGFVVGDPPLYFDLTTNATFDQGVGVCFPAPLGNLTEGAYALQRLLHFADGAWEDITTEVRPATRQVCGRTTSFSPFVVGLPARPQLTVSTPADLVVPATGPHGARVTYAAPVVTGSLAGTPAAACAPASGSVLPIGTTVVTCSVTDGRYANSPVSRSFTVRVTGATEQLAALRTAVTGVGSGGTLEARVATGQTRLAAGDVRAACRGLVTVGAELVNQLARRRITAGQAAALGVATVRIGIVLRC